MQAPQFSSFCHLFIFFFFFWFYFNLYIIFLFNFFFFLFAFLLSITFHVFLLGHFSLAISKIEELLMRNEDGKYK